MLKAARDEQIFEREVCSRVCVWRTGVITTLANESTLWLDSLRSGITMPGLVVRSSSWAVSTLLQTEERKFPAGALYPTSETDDAFLSFAYASLGSQVILLMAEVLSPGTAEMLFAVVCATQHLTLTSRDCEHFSTAFALPSVVTLPAVINEVHPLATSQSPITARTAISM